MLELGTPPWPAFACCNNFLSLTAWAFSQSTRLPFRFPFHIEGGLCSIVGSASLQFLAHVFSHLPVEVANLMCGVHVFTQVEKSPCPPFLSSLFPPQTVFSDVVQTEFEASVLASESHFLGVNFQKWTISWSDDCSGVYLMPTSTRSVMWEDWPLPRCPDRVIGLYHWPNILTTFSTDFILAEHLLPRVFTLLRVFHLFTIKDTVPTAHARITQGNTGRPGMCPKLSEITRKASHRAPGLVGRWMQWGAAGLSCLVGFTALPLACQYPVGHN